MHISPKYGVVVGFDFEVRAEFEVSNAEGSGKPFLVHRGLLVEAIRNATRADKSALVTVSVSAGKKGRSVLVEAAGYSISLETHDVAEFPERGREKVTHKFTVSGRSLKKCINRVSIAATKDDTLPILTGVQMIHEGNELTLLATDRYRLAKGSIRTTGIAKSPVGFILKAKFLAEVSKRTLISQDVVVSVLNGDKVRFELPGGVLESLVVDGDYPKIKSLFPEDCPISFDVDRVPLLNAALTAQALAERNTPAVLDFTDKGVQVGFNVGLFGNSTSPVIDGSFTGHTYEAFQTAFNPYYLVPALKSIEGDVVRFGCTKAGKPVLVTESDSPDYQHLIMPVRLPSKVEL